MSYRNSVKLLISNFSIVWKQLLYLLIISLLCFSISYSILIPTIKLIRAEGIISEITSIFETIYTAPSELFTAVQNTGAHLVSCLKANFGTIWPSIFGAIIFARIIFSILKYISYYNVTSVMHMKMTCFVEVGYTRNLISNLSPAFRYAFSRIVYSIPFTVVKALTLVLYFKSASSIISVVIGLFICFMVLIMLSAIETSLFVGHAPTMIEQNGEGSAFKAFLVGCKSVFKKYARILSNAIVICITIIVLNLFLGIFTVGSALLITLPASIVFKCIFDLSAYLGATGKRYYLAENTLAVSNQSEQK